MANRYVFFFLFPQLRGATFVCRRDARYPRFGVRARMDRNPYGYRREDKKKNHGVRQDGSDERKNDCRNVLLRFSVLLFKPRSDVMFIACVEQSPIRECSQIIIIIVQSQEAIERAETGGEKIRNPVPFVSREL